MSPSAKSPSLPVLLLIACLAVAAADFSHWWPAEAVAMSLLAVSTLLCLPRARGFSRWFAIAMGISVIGLAAELRPSWQHVVTAATGGAGLIGVMLFAEVLGAAVQMGGFDTALTSRLSRHARTAWSMRMVAFTGTLLLTLAGTFVAATPTVFYALASGDKRRDLPLAISASRGFAVGLFVFPFTPFLALALSTSGLSISQYLLGALPLFVALVALDMLPRRSDAVLSGPPSTRGAAADLPPWPRLAVPAVLATFLAFVLTYLWLGWRGNHPLIQIALSVGVAAMVLGLVDGRRWLRLLPGVPAARFGPHLAAAPLFVWGAVFGSLAVATGLLEPVAAVVRAFGMPLLEVPAMILLLVALRWAGVSPAISVLLLGPVLVKGTTLPPLAFAFSLIMGGVLGFTAAPLSIQTLFISAVSGRSPLDICIRQQGAYALLALAAATAYAAVLM